METEEWHPEQEDNFGNGTDPPRGLEAAVNTPRRQCCEAQVGDGIARSISTRLLSACGDGVDQYERGFGLLVVLGLSRGAIFYLIRSII